MSMAMKYAMKKRMAKGGMMCADGGMIEKEKESGYEAMPMVPEDKDDYAADMEDDRYMDSIDGDHDLVDRIMRRYSKGGMVANDTNMTADMEPTEFDDLVKDDGLEFNYTGANSGDELGDAQENDDRRDIVSRIMRSRAKKDRMPRPA